MASSSHSSSFALQKHDVFLSFRGEDTRDSFTSHLYAALRRKKIGTYIDYRLEKGDEISPALVKAIGESKISVIIFSQNYASSTWCLDELVHILSCKDENGQLVIPVFYRVDPSDVRKQQGSYATAFAALEERFAAAGIEKVRQWRRALTMTANLSGWDSSVTKPEAELVEEIVKDILKKLKPMAIRDEYKGLVGIQRRIERIESILRIGSPEVRCICVWGMGGIGKTTLARIVFNGLSSQFEGCCFVENIGEKLKMLGCEGLKNEVFSTLLDEKASNMTMCGGSYFYEGRIRYSKVLIVLDDLKNLQELRLLVGDDDWFGPGSRIIVTTRDKQLLTNQIDDDQIYEVDGLNYDEALQLFNLNAFKRNSPTTDCTEISKAVIDYSKGNPLALNVLGSFFGGRREERWKDALDKLKKLPNDEIQTVLKISYDGLDRMQKDIFLDIACFFEGNDRDHVERILDACDFSANIGIDDLIDKSLVIVVNNKLRMHSLLQEMGQEIVRQQSITNPGERSRIWLANDVFNVLKDNTGTQKIEGIFLDMSEIKREVYLSPTIFQMMFNLRLLKFYNLDAAKKCKVYLPEDLHYLPNVLRYLHWDGYPTKALPANFSAECLVELIMPNNQVEKLWSGVQNLTSLRKIDLSYSENLSEISSLSEARNLEHVYLEYCGSLSQVPVHFKDLDKLKTLILEGCSSLKVFPDLPRNIECLILSGTGIEEVPSSIEYLTQLQILCMRDCERLVSLPTTICKLESLYSLSLSGCSNLERFPEILEPMQSLMMLELDKTSIKALPSTIRNLTGIEHFTLEDHKLIPPNICKRESSICLSLLHFKRSMNQRLRCPLRFFYERHCPSMEIVSISRSALTQGSDDFQVLCGKEFLFYNYWKIDMYRYGCDDDNSELKFLHSEIQRRSKVKRSGFLEADVGVCYTLDTEIPKWFRHQFEDCSSVRIRLNKEEIFTFLGVAICIVSDFGENYFDHNKFKLLCQAHYQLSDGYLLSWDFYPDYDHSLEVKRILKSFIESQSHDPYNLNAESLEKFALLRNLIVPEVVFDFYFVDENHKPLQGCSLKRCGINLLFEEDLKEPGFFGEKDSKKYEFEPSGSGLLDSYAEEEEQDKKTTNDQQGRKGVESVVSISRNELTQCFDQHKFLFYGFLQLHGRDGMDNPKIKVLDQEILSLSKFKGVLRSTSEDIGAWCPGSEISNFFEHKYNKSQMWIDLPPDWLDNSNFLGFVLCAIVELKDTNCFNRFMLEYQYGTSVARYSWCSRNCHGNLRDNNGSTYRYYTYNHDYDNFRLTLEDKARRVKREKLNGGEYISYVWAFKLRCVDEKYNPFDQDQCKIRQCAIKHLFADDLGRIGLPSPIFENRPREEETLSRISTLNQGVHEWTAKEKLVNLFNIFNFKRRNV